MLVLWWFLACLFSISCTIHYLSCFCAGNEKETVTSSVWWAKMKHLSVKAGAVLLVFELFRGATRKLLEDQDITVSFSVGSKRSASFGLGKCDELFGKKYYTTGLSYLTLMVSCTFPDGSDQSPFLVKRNGTRLPYSSHDHIQPVDHGCSTIFEQLCTDVKSIGCLFTPERCHSLNDFVARGWGFIIGWISIHYI